MNIQSEHKIRIVIQNFRATILLDGNPVKRLMAYRLIHGRAGTFPILRIDVLATDLEIEGDNVLVESNGVQGRLTKDSNGDPIRDITALDSRSRTWAKP
jgi:hypothetical protein